MIDPRELDIAPRLGTASYRISVIGASNIVRESHLPAYNWAGWEVLRIVPGKSHLSYTDRAYRLSIDRYAGVDCARRSA